MTKMISCFIYRHLTYVTVEVAEHAELFEPVVTINNIFLLSLRYAIF